jgi:hypothetical protein
MWRCADVLMCGWNKRPAFLQFAHLHIDPLTISPVHFAKPEFRLIFAILLTEIAMAVTRLKRKNRKDKAKAAVRRQTLKIQNFQPVIKNVDIEKIKEEFKAKAPKKA